MNLMGTFFYISEGTLRWFFQSSKVLKNQVQGDRPFLFNCNHPGCHSSNTYNKCHCASLYGRIHYRPVHRSAYSLSPHSLLLIHYLFSALALHGDSLPAV